MSESVLWDAGSLVAFLDHRDAYHAWTVEQSRRLPSPFLTCEPAIAEAFHLLRRTPSRGAPLLEMVSQLVIQMPFQLSDQSQEVLALLQRYSNVPMSLADACLVRMSESIAGSTVFTLDGDFRIYRQHRNRKIPLLVPPGR